MNAGIRVNLDDEDNLKTLVKIAREAGAQAQASSAG